MEMSEIEVLLAVAEEQHFGRAAQRLHLSVSRVSQIVRTLERRIGAPVFDRTSRRVTITPIGEHLVAAARPAYERLVEGLREAQEMAVPRGRQPLAVGFSTSLPAGLPDAVISEFDRRRTDARIIRSDLAPGTFITNRFGQTDFGVDVVVMWAPEGFALDPPPQLSIGPPIVTSARVALMGRRHPLAARPSIDVEELTEHDLLHPGALPAFADTWTPPRTPAGNPLHRVARSAPALIEVVPDMLGAGDLIHLTVAAVPRNWHDPRLVAVPLHGLPPLRCVTAWPSSATTPLITDFAAVAADTAFTAPGIDPSG